MTMSGAANRVEPSLRSAGRARRRRRIVVIAVLVVLVAVAGWWWSHPRLFPEPGNAVGMDIEPGRRVYLGMAMVPDGESIHLRGASARVLHVDNDADVGVVVCRLVDPLSAVGAVDATGISELCRSVGAPSGRVQAGDQLLVEVVADADAVVVVEGSTSPMPRPTNGVPRPPAPRPPWSSGRPDGRPCVPGYLLTCSLSSSTTPSNSARSSGAVVSVTPGVPPASAAL